MLKLKKKRYITLLVIMILFLSIVALSFGKKNDEYSGLVKVKESNISTKLLGSVGDAVLDDNEVKGNSTVEYEVSFTLDEIDGLEKRDAIIKASLTNEEFKYARFKAITGSKITSTLIDNGKEIEVLVKDVRLGQEKKIKLKLILTNAPNEVEIKPLISVKEATGNYTNLNTDVVTVSTNSVEGIVKDENNLPVKDIEIAIKQNNEIIKKSYTNSEGKYIITDLEEGSYELDVDEDNYEVLKRETVDVLGRTEKDFFIRQVEPYQIETHKYITSLKLILDGKEHNYTYDDKEEVLESIKKANTISGEIRYKLVVKNIGDKAGTVEEVSDIPSEGLKLKDNSNGWEEVDGIYYYRPIEGVSLEKYEEREIGLTLEIESTSAAKTYINKMTTKGEIYEKVVYILDGEKYKEEKVLEGEKIEEPVITTSGFDGWYTDKNRSNKYNFNLSVNKDLILYGYTEEQKFKVDYVVDDEVIESLEVDKGDTAENIEAPEKTGNTFKYWSTDVDGEEYDFSTPVEDNLTLYGVYELNEYTITFKNGDDTYGEVQTVKYRQNAVAPETNPEKQYFEFKYWSLEEDGEPYSFSTPIEHDLTLHAVFERIKYRVKFINDGEIIKDEEVDAGTLVSPIEVTKEGYDFRRWSEQPNGSMYDFNTPLSKDLTLYAVYEIKHFNVTYMSNGTQYGDIETVDYNQTATKPTTDPEKQYYRFKYWSLTENGSEYNFSTPVKNNLTLYAVFEILKYRVIFIDDNSTIRDEVLDAGSIVYPPEVSKTGYTFSHWSLERDGEKYTFGNPLTNDLTVYSVYEIDHYNVDFFNEGTKVNTISKEYNSTLSNEETPIVTKEGYTFTYWSLEGETTPYEFSTLITQDIRLNSNYEIQKKAVTFNDDNRITSVEVDWGTKVNPIESQGKTGYTFSHWSLEVNGLAFDFNTVIKEPTTLYAVYNLDTYSINYVLDGGAVTGNPDTYTILSDDITINNPTKTGYDFTGWTESTENPQNPFVIRHGSTGNKTLTAHYTPTEYSIGYTYNGGSLPTGVTNQDKYYITSDTITINNPTKTGYTFVGWNDGNETKNPYVINSGSTGNINLSAVYTPVQYTISYVLDGGTASGNPEEYTIESPDITINNPSKTGYTFTGWTESTENPQNPFIIHQGSTGNKTLTAHYTPIEYSISYTYNGGSLPTGVTNPDKYYITSDTITINNPSKTGYTFTGWNDGNETKNPYVINNGSTGDINLSAEYIINNYTITFMDDNTEFKVDHADYNTTVSEPEEQPSKVGYRFDHWSLEVDGEAYNFNTPITNDITLYSVYEINNYTITFMNGTTLFETKHADYNTTVDEPINKPTKDHNIFLNWTLNNEVYDFNTPITSDITLYSSFELVEAPNVIHTPVLPTWVGDHVLVTINSEHNDYTYYYRINNGTVRQYQEPFEVDINADVYAYSVKSNISSTETKHTIDNIDKVNPTIVSLTNTALTPVTATIKIDMSDLESGVSYYKVYNRGELIYTRETLDRVEHSYEEEYTVTNLQELSDYVIKVELFDNVGNSSFEEITVSTPAKHYVVRTMTNLDGDGVEISKYESIKEALESTDCTSTCNLQMIDNTEESNDILQGKNITLDINGYTITGTEGTAFNNYDRFKVIDKAETPGKIYSSGVGIYNASGATLIVGHDERPAPQEVSTVAPVVEGAVYGIQSDGTLNFYDGRIIGITTSVLGNVDDTPYLYNTTVKSDLIPGKEVEILVQLAEAEARIRSTYYTKVQGATDDSKNGSYEDVDETSPIKTRLQHDGNYRFFYNEETGQVISANQYVANSIAHSYIKLDLTNYSEPQLLTVNAEISSQSGYDIGYVYITKSESLPDLNSTEGRLFSISGIVNAKDYTNILANDSVYYIHLIYKKNADTNSNKDLFIINDIYLGECITTALTDLENASLITDSKYYFERQQDGSFVNNNQGIDSTTANSYIVVDMTNIDEERVIGIEASVSSEGNNDYGYVTITHSNAVPSYNNATNRRILISGVQERKRYLVSLIPNKVNYIHFGYYKNNYYTSGSDEFRIYSIYTMDDSEPETMDGEVHNKETYYFDSYDYDPGVWKDLSRSNNHGTIVGATANSEENGFVFDGNDYVRIGQLNYNEFTWQVKFNATGDGVIIGNYENGGAGIRINNERKLYEEIYIDGQYRYLYSTDPIEYNRDYVLTMTFKNGTAKLYLDGVLQDSYEGTTLKHPESNTVLMLGAGPSGTTPDGSYYKGTIYNAKVYNRELSESEITGIASDDGLKMYLEGSNYKKLINYKKYVSNNHADNSVANSYLVFDLTDSVSDIELTVNATISSEGGYDYGYITVTDSDSYPSFDQTQGRYVFVSGDSTANYPVILTAGRVNYLHLGYRKDSSSARGSDSFYINYIKYYRDSDRTIPVYILGGEDDEISGTYPVPVLNQEVDTVQILRDITLTNPLEIVETRDVVLDLNGYTLTTSKDDYVVKNKGNLTIIDSKYENEKTQHHSEYEESQAVYDAEYNVKLEEQNTFIENLQEQYDAEYAAAVIEYEESGGESGGSSESIPLTSNYFDGVISSYDPLYVTASYSGTQRVVNYKKLVDSNKIDKVKGSLSYWNDYGNLNIGKLIIGFSTSNENRMDDFVSYEEYDILSSETTTLDYEIPVPDTPGNYYIKAILYHNNNVYAYTVYMKINSMILCSAPIKKNATDKIMENASNIYDVTDYASEGLLVNLDALNSGILPDTWTDLSGNNNDFTSTNVTNTSQGMKYNGSNSQSILTGLSSGLESETVEVMFSTNTSGNQVYYNGNSNQFIGIGTWDGYIIVSNKNSVYTYNIPSDLANGKIHTISVTYGLDEYNAYYDGEPLTRRTNTNNWGSDTNTYIGRRSNGNYFNGTIYGVRIYNRELSSPEITKNYNVSIARYNYGEMKRPIVTEETTTINGNISSTTNSVILNDVSGNMVIRSGEMKLDKSGSYSVIVNRGKLSLGDGAIVNAKQSSNRGITNTISGDIQDGAGTINTLSSGNIGILNESLIDNNIKGYKVTTVSRDSYDFYNNGEHDLTLDNMSLTGNGMAIYQNRDYNLTVNNSVVHTKNPNTNSTETYYSNESGIQTTVTFNNCDIVGRIYNRRNSNRKIVVNDSTSSIWTPSYNYFNFYNYQGILEINNSILVKNGEYPDQVIDNGGTLIVNNCVINNDIYGNANGRMIANWNSDYTRGNATITNTKMNYRSTYSYDNNGYYAIYNYGDMVIDGGSLSNKELTKTGIFNAASSNLTIKGNFELSNFVRGVNNNGVLTLGDNEEPVSNDVPTISADQEAINGSNTSTFNFYDGKLIGTIDKTLNSIVNDVPTDYDLVVDKDEKEIITLGPIVGEEGPDVCQIGSTKYKSIQAAVDAVPNNGTQTEIELLKDIYTARTVSIPENKNVLLNQKNFGIKTFKEGTYITNDGILSFTDDSNEVTAMNSYLSNKFIINNGTLKYDKVNTKALKAGMFVDNTSGNIVNIQGGLISSNSQNKLIDNNGTLNISGGTVSETVSTDSVTYMIDNHEDSVMSVTGGTIERNNRGSATVSRAINNSGTLTISDGNFKMAGYFGVWKGPGGQPVAAIQNNSGATTTITGGNFNNDDTQRSKIIENAGTANISNITSNFTHIGKNTGTMILTDVTMNNLCTDDQSPSWHYGTQPHQFDGLRNTGTLTITGGTYKYYGTGQDSRDYDAEQGNNSILNIGGGTVNISSAEFISDNRGITVFNSSSCTIDDTEIRGTQLVATYDSSSAVITDSTLTGSSNAVRVSGTSNYSMENTDVTTTNGLGIDASTTGNINIINGTVIGTSNGINNSGASTITIGVKGDGDVSKTNPEITGNTFGLNNTNTNATINFYDGVISGQTAINGKVADIESGYDIILETDTSEHKFLDRRPLVENTTTHVQYYTVQEGVDAAQNGETLQFLRENTTTPDTETIIIPSGKTVTIDINGFKIYKNNDQYLINNGTLTLEDSKSTSSSYSGQYIINSVGDFIENNGTLILNSVDIYQKVNDEVIVNNTGGTVNFVSEQIVSDLQNTLVTNSGTVNISGGKISETIANGTTYNVIVNNETAIMNITGGTIQKYNSTTVVSRAISNSGTLNISGGTFLMKGTPGYLSYYGSYALTCIYNTPSGDVTITGGNFNNEGQPYSSPSILIDNLGVADIHDINSNYTNIGINTGTLTITNITMESLQSTTDYSTGYLDYGFRNSNGTTLITESLFRYSGGYYEKALFDAVSGTLTIRNTETHAGKTFNMSNYNENTILNIEDSNIYGSQVFYLNGRGITNIKDSTVAASSDIILMYGSNYIGNPTFNMENTSMTTTNGNGIKTESVTGAVININSGSITSTSAGITNNGTATINLLLGTITSNTYGINNSGNATITVGTKMDGAVSKVDPEISGTTVGLNNTNSNATINFYDGIIKGNTAIVGSVTEVEPNYEIIQDTEGDKEVKYLDKLPIVENTTTHIQYDTIQEGVTAASNGDTLLVLRQLTVLPSDGAVTIPSGKTVTIDLAGHTIITNNTLFLDNAGALTVTDSSTGGTISSNSSQIFNNTGTLNITGGSYEKLYDGSRSILVNTGIVNISDGTMTTNVPSSITLIDNSNELNISGGNITPSYTRAIQNTGITTITGGVIKKLGGYDGGNGYASVILNDTNGQLTINSSSGEITNSGYGDLIQNNGTLTVTNGNFSNNTSAAGNTLFINAGTATITGGTYGTSDSRIVKRFFTNTGTMDVSNVDFYSTRGMSASAGTLTFNNVNIDIAGNGGDMFPLNGSSNFTATGGSITMTGDVLAFYFNDSNVSTFNNVPITINGDLYLFGGVNVTFNGGYITNTNTNKDTIKMRYSANLTMDQGFVLTSHDYGLNNAVNGATPYTGTINIKDASIISTAYAAIYNTTACTIIIGEQGGVPSATNPSLTGATYGIYNSSNNANIYFYDGIISGQTGSIYGTIKDVEPGYKEVRNPNTIDDIPYTSSTLAPLGEEDVVVVVNNTNFASLQSAVNYAVANEIATISLQKDYALEADLIKPSGIDVNIYTNGHTLTTTGYNVSQGINIVNGQAPSGLGGAIYKFLANITGTETNPKNIIIYQMEDGTDLRDDKYYKLYELSDGSYNIVKFNEEKIGNYSKGSEQEKIYTLTGKLYLYGLGPGQYKLVGQDNKEIDFEIYENSVSDNILINNKTNVVRKAETYATLILTFGTGILRSHYILLILLVAIIVLTLVAIKKKREEL